VRGVGCESVYVSVSRPVMDAGQAPEHTTTESDSVHIAIPRLSSHQFSSKHIDLPINGCDRMRGPLQRITFRHFLPACCQSASHASNPIACIQNFRTEAAASRSCYYEYTYKLTKETTEQDSIAPKKTPRDHHASYDHISHLCIFCSSSPKQLPFSSPHPLQARSHKVG
jgi:hypothetical protein